MNKPAFSEAGKEFGRVIVLAIIPVLITLLEQPTFSWRAALVAIAIAALRAVDKYRHEDPGTKANGLVPF